MTWSGLKIYLSACILNCSWVSLEARLEKLRGISKSLVPAEIASCLRPTEVVIHSFDQTGKYFKSFVILVGGGRNDLELGR